MNYIVENIKNSNLDCEIFKWCIPGLTYRKYIETLEGKLNMGIEPIGSYSDEELKKYVEELESGAIWEFAFNEKWGR